MKSYILISSFQGNKLCRDQKFNVWSFATSVKFLLFDLSLLRTTTQLDEDNRPKVWAIDRTRPDKILIYSSLSEKHIHFWL